MPAAPQSPAKHSSMQPTRPAPTPPVGSLQSPTGTPVKRSPSSPYPSRSVEPNNRPVITTIPSSGIGISELVPQRPAPRPPPQPAKRTSNVLVKGGGHHSSQSTSSISSIPEKSKTALPGPKRPPPPLSQNSIPIAPPMPFNPEYPSAGASQSARVPTNGAPSIPNHRARRSDSRTSDGTSPQASRGSPRARSDEYGTTKSDKSIFGKFVSGMAKGLGSNSSKKEKIEISTPYDPVHLTHVGFNYNTGEFTVTVF
jgi:p21-activated kinase 1